MFMFDSKPTQSGFTLVEIAIVIMIIGLLVGGIFAGMKLRENAQTMDIIKQLLLYESSAIKFKEVYGELPGDIMFPSAKLPNCNTAPCNRGGNGDDLVNSPFIYSLSRSSVDMSEVFTFWNHLLAAGFISGIRGTEDLTFGQGQPGFDIGGGLLVVPPWYQRPSGWTYDARMRFMTSRWPDNISGGTGGVNHLPCRMIENIDIKLDDGLPFSTGGGGPTSDGRIYIDNTFNGCWDGVHPAGIHKRYTIQNSIIGGFYYRTKIRQ